MDEENKIRHLQKVAEWHREVNKFSILHDKKTMWQNVLGVKDIWGSRCNELNETS